MLIYLCFFWYDLIWDYYHLRWWCIDISILFPPCECADGQECEYRGGEAGGGDAPCTLCPEGEAPNDDGGGCVVCEHGESSTAGECNPDPCEGVTCSENAHCENGYCQCNAGYVEKTEVKNRYGGEPELETKCEDPCAEVRCGKNAYCLYGTCRCESGFEGPDKDGNCRKKCLTGYHDPDADGVCTKACNYAETDAVAKVSLRSFPKEPWERMEWYACTGNLVVVERRESKEAAYKSGGDVCGFKGVAYPPLAAGHSHPYFTWDPNKSAEENAVNCAGELLVTKKRMEEVNEIGTDFSISDKNFALGSGKPLYLVVPERNEVKVFRHRENCPTCDWAVERL